MHLPKSPKSDNFIPEGSKSQKTICQSPKLTSCCHVWQNFQNMCILYKKCHFELSHMTHLPTQESKEHGDHL